MTCGLVVICGCIQAEEARHTNSFRRHTKRFRPPSLVRKSQQQARYRDGLRSSNTSLWKSRGGALDVFRTKIVTAKIATTVSFVQGLMCWFVPGRTCQFYQIPLSRAHEFAMKQVGNILTQIGLIGIWLFFRQGRNVDSLGLAAIFRAFNAIVCLLKLRSATTESTYPATAVILSVLLWNVYLSALLLTKNRENARLMERFNASIQLIVGIIFSWNPGIALSNLNLVDLGADTRILAKLTRGYGLWLISLSVLSSGLAWNFGSIQALAFSRLVVLCRTVIVHFLRRSTGQVSKLQVAWLSYHSIIAFLLVFPDLKVKTFDTRVQHPRNDGGVIGRAVFQASEERTREETKI